RRARCGKDQTGDFEDAKFNRIADIDGLEADVWTTVESEQGIDRVFNVAERACLRAVAKNADGLIAQRLHYEVRNNAPIVRRHAGAIGIENAGDAGIRAVLARIVGAKGLGGALSLVVTGPGAKRI